MKSSSLRLVEIGVDPSKYRDSLIHQWYLEPQFSEKLEIYILRETVPADLFFHIKDGELKVKGRLFSVIWVNSPATIREANYALISMRFCKYLDRGYALVKVLKGNTEYEKLEY